MILVVNFTCDNGHPITTFPVEADGEPTPTQAEAWSREIVGHTLKAIKDGVIWSFCPHCGASLRSFQIEVRGSSFATLEQADSVLDEGSRIGTEEAKSAIRRWVQ